MMLGTDFMVKCIVEEVEGKGLRVDSWPRLVLIIITEKGVGG